MTKRPIYEEITKVRFKFKILF